MWHTQPGSWKPNWLHITFALHFLPQTAGRTNGAGHLSGLCHQVHVAQSCPSMGYGHGLSLTEGYLCCVVPAQCGYSQWFYNHCNDLRRRNHWIYLNSWIESNNATVLGEHVQETEDTTEWWKSSTTWQQGSIFSMAGKFGFVTHHEQVVDTSGEKWWKNRLSFCYAEAFFFYTLK